MITLLFNAVTKALKTEQTSLNEADSYNHDHGDNMVKNFKVITKAVKQKQGASPSEQLSYASEVLRQKSSSGSANLYSQGLAQAATQLMGQSSVNSGNAMSMVQALIGGGQTSAQGGKAGSGDMLGQLLDGLMGGGQSAAPQTQQAESPSGDMLSGLVGSLLGGGGGGGQSASSGQGGGLDLGSLLSAGASLLGGGQGGGLGSLVNALVGGSAMGDSTHHSQSGNVVVSTLISVLGKVLGGK
jgi:phosphoenolpyruvate---glycerone phosphotransferase subunit DhaL